MDRMMMEKAYLLGISDAEWLSYIELDGEVQHVSRSKEGRREVARDAAKEGRHTVVENGRGLTDTERDYLSVYGGQ